MYRTSHSQYPAQHLARLLILLLIASSSLATAQPFRDRFTAVTYRNFDGGGEVGRQFLLNAGAYRYQATIHRTTGERELPVSQSEALTALTVRHRDGESAFAEYVARDPLIDGVVVLHAGAVLFEAYPNMQPWQRHFAWSVTKVLTSTTLAALVQEGLVTMDERVDTYLPEFKGTAWAGTSVQDIADMASGIDCLDSDGYQDTRTCVYITEEALDITAPTGRNPDFLVHLKQMRRHRPAGTKKEYLSANTNMLALVIEAVTAQPFAEVVQERIWRPIGAEADALMAISRDGFVYASGGLSARLRDVARFGEIFTTADQPGVVDKSLVDAMQQGGVALDAEELASLEDTFGADLPVRAAWQWDYVWEDGGMFKGGYDGQGLYVDPARRLVVAWFGTGLNFSETQNDMLSISRQLATSGLFAE